jgi:hypothetical protein
LRSPISSQSLRRKAGLAGRIPDDHCCRVRRVPIRNICPESTFTAIPASYPRLSCMTVASVPIAGRHGEAAAGIRTGFIVHRARCDGSSSCSAVSSRSESGAFPCRSRVAYDGCIRFWGSGRWPSWQRCHSRSHERTSCCSEFCSKGWRRAIRNVPNRGVKRLGTSNADVLPKQDKCIPPKKQFLLTRVRHASLQRPRIGLAFAGLPSRCPRSRPTAPRTDGRFWPVGRSPHAPIQRPHGARLSGHFEFFLSPVILPPDTLAPLQSC